MIHQESDIQKKMGVSHPPIRQNRLQVKKKKKETGYKNHFMMVKGDNSSRKCKFFKYMCTYTEAQKYLVNINRPKESLGRH